MTTVEASESESEKTSADRLLGGRLHIAQPLSGYRIAIDPVLLAAATSIREGDRVLDLGCGIGAAALCLLARCERCSVEGLELQSTMAVLARENAARNGFGERFKVWTGDASAPPAELADRRFDAVMTNPPYLAADAARGHRGTAHRLADQESGIGLRDWIDRAVGWLKPRGRLTLIQRADRLDEVIAALQGKAGAITVFPLWPRSAQPAKRVIVAAVKGSRAPARLLPGLTLHDEAGFTADAEAVLRDGAALDLGT